MHLTSIKLINWQVGGAEHDITDALDMPVSQKLNADKRREGGKQGLKGVDEGTEETENCTVLQRSQWRAEGGQRGG